MGNHISENEVASIFLFHRYINAAIKTLEENSRYLDSPYNELGVTKIMNDYHCLNKIADIWLTVLTEEESYLIKRHLIDHIEWAKIMVEYSRQWNDENARSERTLKRKQQKAIEKLINYSKRTFSNEFINLIKNFYIVSKDLL